MNIDLAALPDDVATLHEMIGDLAAALDSERAEARAEIERLRRIVKMLQRSRFGPRSERLDPDQLQLGLEDLDTDIAQAEADLPPAAPGKERRPRRASGDRPSLPDHLPREDVTLDIGADACPCCGGAVHEIGETVSEMLDYVPARLRVYGCRACRTIHQAPAPERTIAKGLATPGLIAHVMVNKYCDHLPLYRQSQIFARQGVDLNRSTLANWVGGACWWLEALHARLAHHVFASDSQHETSSITPGYTPRGHFSGTPDLRRPSSHNSISSSRLNGVLSRIRSIERSGNLSSKVLAACRASSGQFEWLKATT
jgi:transposase